MLENFYSRIPLDNLINTINGVGVHKKEMKILQMTVKHSSLLGEKPAHLLFKLWLKFSGLNLPWKLELLEEL